MTKIKTEKDEGKEGRNDAGEYSYLLVITKAEGRGEPLYLQFRTLNGAIRRAEGEIKKMTLSDISRRDIDIFIRDPTSDGSFPIGRLEAWYDHERMRIVRQSEFDVAEAH